MPVTLLEKPAGQTWSEGEVSALRERCMVEIEQLRAKPHRLAVMNKPLSEPISTVLQGVEFTMKEVEYRDRWS